MKTRVSLIASLVVISAFIFLVVPVQAQRRSANQETVKQRNEQKSSAREIKDKNAVRKDESKTKNTQSDSQGRRTSVQRKQSASAPKSAVPSVRNRGNSTAQEKKDKRINTSQEKRDSETVQRRTPKTNRSSIRNAPGQKQRESFRSTGTSRNGAPQAGAVTRRARTEHNRSIYKVDSKDSRYTPGKDFKGNRKSWDANLSRHHVNYKKQNEVYYRHYDHRKYMHWDRQWETYTWNVNSWRDYYNGYHPYSFKFHKHYFYHPGYGHVIRRFGYKPEYFIHNNIRYYNFNGHFFRHFHGVGYVLVDMPYGLVFQRLPKNSERVYINGYLYFRAGNLFFEKHPYGFALIHYPERYYALEAGFYNGGYYREVDYRVYR